MKIHSKYNSIISRLKYINLKPLTFSVCDERVLSALIPVAWLARHSVFYISQSNFGRLINEEEMTKIKLFKMDETNEFINLK